MIERETRKQERASAVVVVLQVLSAEVLPDSFNFMRQIILSLSLFITSSFIISPSFSLLHPLTLVLDVGMPERCD